MSFIKKLRDSYVIRHVNNTKIPEFPDCNIVRKKVTFSGRVQKVGFRMEIYCLAERIQLTGWVKNLEDGRVEAELQGNEAKIYFLTYCMENLKRSSVKKMTMINVPIVENEENFTIVKNKYNEV